MIILSFNQNKAQNWIKCMYILSFNRNNYIYHPIFDLFGDLIDSKTRNLDSKYFKFITLFQDQVEFEFR